MLRLLTNKVTVQGQINHLFQKPIIILSRTLSTNVKATSNKAAINDNVPGLSENCCKLPNAPVGPGASKEKEYKNPEYFCYHVDSFGEAEVELAKYRLPTPSNKVPYKQ